jgi:hypothetical protein
VELWNSGKFVKSLSTAHCHSERSEESNLIKRLQILHLVQDDRIGFLTRPSIMEYWKNGRMLRQKIEGLNGIAVKFFL